MKKLVFVFAIGAVGLTSCGGSESAADINVADIKDGCGCVDKMNVVADEVLATIEPFATEEDLEKDEAAVAKVETLEKKFDEIEDRCRKELDVKKSDLEECGGFKDLDSKMEKIEDKL